MKCNEIVIQLTLSGNINEKKVMKGVLNMKKKISGLIVAIIFMLFLGACSTTKDDSVKEEKKKTVTSIEKNKEDKKEKENSSISNDESENLKNSESAIMDSSFNNINESDVENHNPLVGYSDEQIEYSRVWLQLMGDILTDETYTGLETLYVDRKKEGSYLDSTDKTSVVYPIEVVRLSGTREIDGYLTYKSNGNGTITVYDFPYRWDHSVKEYLNNNNINSAEYAQSIIDNGHTVSIGVGNNEEIKEIINVMNIR